MEVTDDGHTTTIRIGVEDIPKLRTMADALRARQRRLDAEAKGNTPRRPRRSLGQRRML